MRCILAVGHKWNKYKANTGMHNGVVEDELA
jgi:hypothetical protein